MSIHGVAVLVPIIEEQNDLEYPKETVPQKINKSLTI